jgi:uncharacterized protein (DUF2267 family)
MTGDEFTTIVSQGIGGGREQAEHAIHAVLQTLGERIDRNEARNLAAELPDDIAPWIATDGPAEGFDADEFLRRVAERETVDVATARRHTQAVLVALWRAVSRKEFDDMVAELPSDFVPLLPRGPDVDQPEPDEVASRVAEHAGLDVEAARRATAAVLEVLAERIAGGEVEDLMERLPAELHEPLRRGMERAGGRAQPLSAARFVELVAEREDVDAATAAAHARAVFQALRELVGQDEMLDVTAQLPDELVRTLVR